MKSINKKKYNEIMDKFSTSYYIDNQKHFNIRLAKYQKILENIQNIVGNGERRAYTTSKKIILTTEEINKLQKEYKQLDKVSKEIKLALNIQYDSVIQMTKEVINNLEEYQ